MIPNRYSGMGVPSNVISLNDERLYDRNHCCTGFVVAVNFLTGLLLPGLEIGQLFYIWSLNFLRLRDVQFSLFNESAPGIWLGALFIATGISGIIARVTKHDAEKRHVRFTVFATFCLINTLASLAMIVYTGYTLERMRWDYPYQCKGYPYAGTYDHICDYEQGFYIVIGFLVVMMGLYCIQLVNSILGCIFAFQKVCKPSTGSHKRIKEKPVQNASNQTQYVNVLVKPNW